MPQLEPSDKERIAKLEADSTMLPAYLSGEIEKLKAENQQQQIAIIRQQRMTLAIVAAVAASLIGGNQIDKLNENLGKAYQLMGTIASLYVGYKAIEEGKKPE